MTTETNSNDQEPRGQKVIYRRAASSPVYGLGFLGALVYYISQATTFWLGVLGLLKATVWPAMLVYELLTYLNL